MLTWPKASSTPSLAIMRFARARASRACASLSVTAIPLFRPACSGIYLRNFIFGVYFGDQSFAASSKPSNENPGATASAQGRLGLRGRAGASEVRRATPGRGGAGPEQWPRPARGAGGGEEDPGGGGRGRGAGRGGGAGRSGQPPGQGAERGEGG